ncbi:MAG: ImmA/IrrE family metallo-endopeptidase [Ignavibacteriaceae bacterium]|nr:ImmA/IrrE family metallo-endopeptidase [Ignavibacteriaceae bacterium]
MAKSIPALVNKEMLKWARIHAGYDTVKEVSSKTKFPEKNLSSWENGEKIPSVRQAEKLAKFYHCSFSIFSLKERPTVTPLAKEYRRLPGVKPGKESPELRFALRDMIYRRRIAINLTEELGDTPKEFSISASLSENPEALASRIRKLLGITFEQQFKWKNNSDAWKDWRKAIESLEILVLLFNDVEQEEIRGVSLFHPVLPVIGINNHEKSAARQFTLIHEFVHLLLKNGAAEKVAFDEERSESEWNDVEKFAEQVTGAVLIPQDALRQEPLLLNRAPSYLWPIPELRRLANKYKVTPLAFATRLLMLNLMSPSSYRQWKSNWNEYLIQNPIKDKGFATPAQKTLNRNGNILTSLVIGALTSERITPVDASHYLKTNYPHVEELRLYFAFGKPLTIHSSGE